MGKNSVVGVIAAIVLIVAIVMVARSMSGSSGEQTVATTDVLTTDVFWYDTGSKELYGAPLDLPPLKAPSGSDGVIAFVFATGSCDNAADRFIACLMTYADREAVMTAADMETRRALMEKRLVRRETDASWVEASSPEGKAILEEADKAQQNGVPCRRYRK